MPAIPGARYSHANIVARDWRALATFYVDVLGCTPVPPERDYADEALARVTGLPGAALRGVHLRVPGGGPDDPTLELFTYSALADGPVPAINRPGLAHLAFTVEDVDQARAAIIEAGGGALGETVELTTSAGATVRLAYCTDPEGNIVEVQAWR